MNSSVDYFSREFAKAFERRAKKQALTSIKSNDQHVVQPCNKLTDEQYQTSLLSKMKTRLAQLTANDNSQ